MTDDGVSTQALAILDIVASAIRGALGEEIDAYPGQNDPEGADPINRAFCAIATAIVRKAADDSTTSVSTILRQLAERRLQADSFDDAQVRNLIEEEPGSPDDWLVFLILSSKAQIEHALTDE